MNSNNLTLLKTTHFAIVLLHHKMLSKIRQMTGSTHSSASSSLETQEMSALSDPEELGSTSSANGTVENSDRNTPPCRLSDLNLTIDGLLSPEDIGKVYDESIMSEEDKRRLLMSVYKYAKPTVFSEDSLKTVKRICNEHIVRNVKFINGEFLNDMNRSQRLKATAFGTFYQPDFSDTSPKMWNDILDRMPGCTSMSLQMKAVTWMGILPTVKKAIRSYRNNVQTKIKGRSVNRDSLICALQTINTQGFEATYTGSDLNLLLGLKTIQALAEGFREDNLMKIRDKKSSDVFRAFVHYFLQHTIPKTEWNSTRSSDLVSSIFTTVDEGFAILLIINHWQEWKHVAEGNVIDRRKKLTLYTHCCKNDTSSNEGYSLHDGQMTSVPNSITVDSTLIQARSNLIHSDEAMNDHESVNTSSTETVTTASTNPSSGNKDTCAEKALSDSNGNRNKRAPKVKGWSTAGLRKFSEICKHIDKIRKEPEQEIMEKALLAEYEKLDTAAEKVKTRKRKHLEGQELDFLEEEPFNMYAV